MLIFTAKTVNSSKINAFVSGSAETIDAFTVDVQSFGIAEMQLEVVILELEILELLMRFLLLLKEMETQESAQ
jgi:hypothetical protein